MARQVSLRRARALGLLAVGGVLALQAFNSAACYGHGLSDYLRVLGLFIALPMLPAAVALFTRNPLRAVGASALFAPWLLFAVYTDCVRPYQGGGASMVYVAVLMYGLPCALAGALVTGPLLRRLGVTVVASSSA